MNIPFIKPYLSLIRTTLGVLLVSTLLYQDLLSQDPFHYHFDTETGLPSSEVYGVIFDEEGIGWFPTDRGLCSYNGYEFKVYTTSDSLTNNTVLGLQKDPEGRIWARTLDGSICFLDEGRIVPFQGNDSLGGVSYRGWAILDFVWDQQGRMIFWHSPTSEKVEGFYRWDAKAANLESFTFDCLLDEYPHFEFPEGPVLDLGIGILSHNSLNNFSMLPDSTCLYTKGYKPTVLYWARAGQEKVVDSISLPGIINGYYFNEQDGLWVGSSRGLYHFEDFKSPAPPTVYFKNLIVSRLAQDAEGNYWVSSLSDGVRCIPSFKFKYPSSIDSASSSQTCLSLAKTDDFLVVGGMKGELLVVDSAFQIRTLLNDPGEFGIYSDPQNSRRGINYPKIRVGKNPGEKEAQVFRNKATGRHIFDLNDSIQCLITDLRITWLNRFTNERNTCFTPRTFSSRAISAMATDSCIWIGAISGLIRLGLDPENFSMELEDFGAPPLAHRVNDLKGDSLGRLFAGTSGNGLVIVEKGIPHVFQEKDGLSSNMINRVWVENEHTVWIGSNRGLDRLVFDREDNYRIVKLDQINSSHGLPSNFIRDLLVWKEKLWLATNSGLIYLDPDEVIKDSLPIPEVKFDKVRVNKTYYYPNTVLDLNYDENNIIIDFLAVSFAQPNTHPFYRYRLSGSDTTWNYTNSRRVQYPELPSGDYTFEVSACNRLQIWDSDPAQLQFSISPHFSKTWWFQGLVLLCLALLVGGGVQLRNRQRRLKEIQARTLQEAELKTNEAKLRTREAELAALRNQMNPHFVFNTLNAIQNFIFRQDAPKANYYLGKFAKLMRDGLEFSLQSFVPLSEELEFLKTYLELESLRFPDRFEYKIKVDDALDPKRIQLPPFLFQPIVENAIKHGFNEINHKGILMIQITGVSNDDITVTIQDNGSGISSATTLDQSYRQYPSRGLQIVQNHIELVNNSIRSASFVFRNRATESGTESIFNFSF